MKLNPFPRLFTKEARSGLLGCLSLLFFAVSLPAQLTWDGTTFLNEEQTYDGLGADADRDPLTLTSGDFNIARGGGEVGILNVVGGTLTLNNEGTWDSKVAFGDATGELNISGGATVNLILSGTSEQRFRVSHNAGSTGTINLDGGDLNVSFGHDNQTHGDRGLWFGSGGGLAIANLNSGTFTYSAPAATRIGTDGTGTINILDGAFVQTGFEQVLIGNNGTINFVSGGSGYISILGWEESDFAALVNSGNITVDGAPAIPNAFAYTFEDGQGIYQLDPDSEILEFLTHPQDAIAWVGEDVAFSATFFGGSETTFEWEVSEDGGTTWTPIPGSDSLTLNLSSVTVAQHNNLYRVVATEGQNEAFSDAAILRVGDGTPPEPEGVVAHYRFEEGTVGSTASGAQDSSGGGRDMGEVIGSPTYSSNIPVSLLPQTAEANDLSIDLSGGNYAIQGTDGDELSQVVFEDFTIEAWVRFNNVAGWQTIVGRDDRGRQNNNNDSLMYFQNASGSNVFRIVTYGVGGERYEINSGFVFQNNVWTHVAAVGDSQAGRITLYANGVEVASGADGFSGLYQPDPATRWTIGRGQWGDNDAVGQSQGDWVNGDIDEVRFSNVALSPVEFLNFHQAVVNFLNHPQDVIAEVGDDVTFTALAGGGGTGPLTYQWQVLESGASDWADLSGATEASLTLESVSIDDHQNRYRVIASRDGDSVSSNAATLSVPNYPPPNVIEGIPSAPLEFSGTEFAYSVEVTGLGNITYQWQRDGVDLEGETTNTLDLGVLEVADSGTYSVTITDDAATQDGLDATTVTLESVLTVVSHSQGAISLNFVGAATDPTWNLDIGPIHPNDPAGIIPVANWNNSADVHGVATRTTPLPLVNDIGAETTATATWASANTWASRVNAGGLLIDKDADQRIFHGYIEGRGGSSVTIQGIPYNTYDVYVYPMGVEGPVDGGFVRSVTLTDAGGDRQLFGRNLSGNPTLADIPFILAQATSIEEAQESFAPTVYRFENATGSTITVDHQDEIDWNLGGIAGISIVNTSAGAPVRPLLTSRPSDRFVPAGGDVQLSVTAQAMNDGGSLSYQWRKDGANISGATNPTLTLSNTTSADTGSYTVVVTENSNLGTITNQSTVTVVVVDDDRRPLLSVDVNVGTHEWMEGHARLRTTGLEPFVFPASETDNPMEIGLGDTIWNRFWGRGGTFSYGDFVDSEGLRLSGVTFTIAGANGAGDTPDGGGLESLSAEDVFDAPLLRDYVFANNANTMTLTLGGLQAFAGRDLTLVVYALGPLSTFSFDNDEDDDIATVALLEANNHLGLDPIATETAEEGRSIRWNVDAIATFDARVAANGTVTWTVGPVPDRPGINAMNGFQVLFSDQGEPIDPPDSDIAAWREQFFGSPANEGAGANDADFDGDGFKNGIEYALGTDPTVAGDAHGAVTVGQDGDFLTLTFSHIDDPNVEYSIQATEDPNAGWTTVHTFPAFNTVGTETYTDTVAISANSRRFIRLAVTINE